jgi:putative transposase
MRRATLYVIKKNKRVTLAIKAVRKQDTIVAIITAQERIN